MPLPIIGSLIESVVGIVGKAADKIIPDAAQKQQFQLEMQKQLQAMDTAELDRSFDVMIAEAQSADKWTSRARPSFMYVMYTLILSAIPIGILYAISPSTAGNISAGFKQWLAAIPDSMWALFGTGYVGYSVARSYDKHMEQKYTK